MGLFKINPQVIVEGLDSLGRGPVFGLRVHRAFPELDECRTYDLKSHMRLKSAASAGYSSFCDAARDLLGAWFDSFGSDTKRIWHVGYAAL